MRRLETMQPGEVRRFPVTEEGNVQLEKQHENAVGYSPEATYVVWIYNFGTGNTVAETYCLTNAQDALCILLFSARCLLYGRQPYLALPREPDMPQYLRDMGLLRTP